MFTRRLIISSILATAAGSILPASAQSAPDWRNQVLMQDRVLHLTREKTGETASVCYWRPGSGYDMQGYLAACHLLRDVDYNTQAYIDLKLLDTLFVIQQWLRTYGKPYQIVILSGYRTPEHNGSLENAAKTSLHVQGKAIDFYIPGVPVAGLAAIGKIVGVGGVGFYPSGNFVHLDTGRVRSWRG
jgi:uncharacterized protein YcbK (DUF882 family)